MSRRKSRRPPATRKAKTKPQALKSEPRFPVCTGRQFAELFGVTHDTVSRWCAAGMPHHVPGKANAGYQIDPATACPWVRTYALEPPKESQRERLAREQADKVALGNAKERGDMIDAATVGDVLRTLASTTSGQLEAVASRCANEFAGITDRNRIHERLREEHRAIRTSVAGIVGRLAEACEGAARDVDAVDAAADANGRSVGGREPRPSEGVS